jgi:WD40 repeat protein
VPEGATGRALGPPLAHRGYVRHVAFSPDGKTVLTTGGDAVARLWPAPQAWNDAPESIRLWLEVNTGLALNREHGVIIALDVEGWNMRRNRLAAADK